MLFKSAKIFSNQTPMANEVSTIQTKARQNPSRVRDHLANERTYLAWMRTAVALMGGDCAPYLIPAQIGQVKAGN